MTQSDSQWDKLLRIRTTGFDDSSSDQYRYPYEPTPYCVLERLAGSGYISKKNVLLDYGCGKGRVDFFLAWQTRCRCLGVEYDPRILEGAKENRKKAAAGARTDFVLADAQEFQLPEEVDRCYFFNPFSLEIFQKTLARILESCYEKPREMQLFFYFPSEEYVGYLMTRDELMFVDEIDCSDLFAENKQRERILIFEVI